MNDSIKPVLLEINLPKTNCDLIKKLHSKVFLIPTNLAPEKQQFYKNMPKKIKRFLNEEIDKPYFFNKILKPKEKCILSFGVLTNLKQFQFTTPFGKRLLTSTKDSKKFSFKFKINKKLIIPCGQFSYINN